VLLRQRLGVIADAVDTGRRTFTNTLKYVNVTISANFGNMLSLAVASVSIPFLPLLPRQILLLNFMSDLPAGTIATDSVDRAQLDRPQRWRVDRIRRFMLVFGAISSVFDLTTFAVLRLGFDAEAAVFRSGWFIESMLTELAAMLVLRTPGRAWRSRPGTGLLATSAAVGVATVVLPFTPVGDWMGFGRPSAGLLLVLLGIVVAYVAVTEWAKERWHRQ
jgi:Mg2+-importing ATPase